VGDVDVLLVMADVDAVGFVKTDVVDVLKKLEVVDVEAIGVALAAVWGVNGSIADSIHLQNERNTADLKVTKTGFKIQYWLGSETR
jgi:hypothetical protein